MKNLLKPLIFILCFSLFASGCSLKKNSPTPSNPYKSAENTPEVTQKEVEPIADTAISDDAIETAEAYKSIYMNVYSGNSVEVDLSPSDMNDIVSSLGTLGYVAIDFDSNLNMTNPQLVDNFFADKDAGNDASVTIYQICKDAGFIRHDITIANGKASVVQTRLAWLSEGDYELAGDIPTITYSNRYDINAITFTDDGYLEYEYDIPDNPPGGNHDGHVDTIERIRVTPLT